MNVLDYEKRVKKYADSNNRGYIHEHQLQEAFKDTDIFKNLHDPSSLESKFIHSDLISNLAIGSKLSIPEFAKPGSPVNMSPRSQSMRRMKKTSIVDKYLSQMKE